MTKYHEIIVVEGLDSNLGGLKINDFQLKRFDELDDESYDYLLTIYPQKIIRNIFEEMQPEFMFFMRTLELPNGSPNKIVDMMERDSLNLDLFLKTLSYNPIDSTVLFSVSFDKEPFTKNNICGRIYFPFAELNCKKQLTTPLLSNRTQLNKLHSQICKYMDDTKIDPKKTSFLYQLSGSMYGSRNQRFISMVIALDMLRKDASGNNSKRIKTIVSKLLPNEPNIDSKITDIYDARTKYVHQGNPVGISTSFDDAYEILIKVSHMILHDKVTMNTLEDEIIQGSKIYKNCWQ